MFLLKIIFVDFLIILVNIFSVVDNFVIILLIDNLIFEWKELLSLNLVENIGSFIDIFVVGILSNGLYVGFLDNNFFVDILKSNLLGVIMYDNFIFDIIIFELFIELMSNDLFFLF